MMFSCAVCVFVCMWLLFACYMHLCHFACPCVWCVTCHMLHLLLLMLWTSSYCCYCIFRWTPPPYTKIQHAQVCTTKEEFHELYNLSLDGVDSTHMMDVSDIDWLSVFTVVRAKGQKVKLRTLRPEFFNKFMVLYQMVYQELPVNGECAAWFAKAFAFENCQRAELSKDKSKHKVAWAAVAASSVSRLGAHKQGLSNKRARLMTRMNEGESKLSLEGPPLKANLAATNTQHADLALALLADVHAKMRDVETDIGQITKEMQQAEVAMQVQSKGETFLQQLQEAREELAKLEASGNAPLERSIQLQAVITANKAVLALLGVTESGMPENNIVADIQVEL